MQAQTMLQVEGIYAGYRKKEILRNVSLSLAEGEILGVIGPNGAGKSTLLKVVAGLLRPAAGRVVFAGRDLTGMPIRRRVNAGIGTFLQGGEVFNSLPVRANLELGGLALSRAERRNRMAEVLAAFPALGKIADERGGLLSGGQRQQLALAIVLMARPRLLLLDEPSAGLSPALVRGFLDRLVELNRALGLTLLIVEQNLQELFRVSHRVCVLKNGEVVGDKRPDDLLKEGWIEKVFFS